MKKYVEFDEKEFSRAKEILNSAGISLREAVVVPTGVPVTDKVQRVLFDMGVRSHTKGFSYICAAVELRPIENGTITKELYPAVAKQFGTTSVNVEKSIRFAIEGAWDAGIPERYRRWFQHPESRPSNGVFLRTILEIIASMEQPAAIENA